MSASALCQSHLVMVYSARAIRGLYILVLGTAVTRVVRVDLTTSAKQSVLFRRITLHNSQKIAETRVRNSEDLFNAENDAFDRFSLSPCKLMEHIFRFVLLHVTLWGPESFSASKKRSTASFSALKILSGITFSRPSYFQEISVCCVV